MVSISSKGSSQNIYSDVKIFENENLKVSIKHYEEANIIDTKWLSFVFYNKSVDTIIIEEFEYSNREQASNSSSIECTDLVTNRVGSQENTAYLT